MNTTTPAPANSLPHQSSPLQGQRALVTGGATRVGAEIVRGLARAGADVVIHFGSNAHGAAAVAAEVRALGRRADLVQADLLSPQAPHELATQALQGGGIDILVNNASIYPDADSLDSSHTIEHESLVDWERSMAINARAPFFLMQALAPALKASSVGNVINLLDRSLSDLFIDRAAHSVSKAALAHITHIAAKSWRGLVRVNGIELGPILPGDTMPPEEAAAIRWAGPAQVVATILYIITTPFINGEIIGLRNRYSLHL
jgi:NAD(P)-dependent dehydrogenase (short-subunit alcohol dehydrogenase family)